ncbi:hypothetical protein FMM58_00905 [Campylobacter sp. LR291e]|uniref:hypothetical protein n=1 Tax=unclassified Campylobacter TaxID=2593542 RepID=UPI00123C75DE|nr:MULTISPECIES: hypothetical protein [unclassified Campylobacter]KAA6229867.1 hypothetical protein FMM56_07490 [Campylobacter sp. LR264d]KAA6234080.1 hypothetical protein FMM58_00905 [Campylobacter sp. LR291e]
MKRVIYTLLSLGLYCELLHANPTTPQGDGIKPRTLKNYVEQEKDFYNYIKKNHLVLNIKRG